MVFIDYWGYLEGTLWLLLIPPMYVSMIGLWLSEEVPDYFEWGFTANNLLVSTITAIHIAIPQNLGHVFVPYEA